MVIFNNTRLFIGKIIIMKVCKTCKQDKPLEDYYSGKGYVGGKNPNCKVCMKASKNKDVQNAASKRYRDRHPEKRLEQNRKYRAENPEKVRKVNTDYSNMKYRTDAVYRLQTILRQQIVDYIKYKKNERIAQLLGYTAEDFITRHGEGSLSDHIDHKIPKSWFVENAPINLIWHLDNLQWLNGVENDSKGNRYMHPVPSEFISLALPYIKHQYLCHFTV